MRMAATPEFGWRQETVVLPLGSALKLLLHRLGQEAVSLQNIAAEGAMTARPCRGGACSHTWLSSLAGLRSLAANLDECPRAAVEKGVPLPSRRRCRAVLPL